MTPPQNHPDNERTPGYVRLYRAALDEESTVSQLTLMQFGIFMKYVMLARYQAPHVGYLVGNDGRPLSQRQRWEHVGGCRKQLRLAESRFVALGLTTASPTRGLHIANYSRYQHVENAVENGESDAYARGKACGEAVENSAGGGKSPRQVGGNPPTSGGKSPHPIPGDKWGEIPPASADSPDAPTAPGNRTNGEPRGEIPPGLAQEVKEVRTQEGRTLESVPRRGGTLGSGERHDVGTAFAQVALRLTALDPSEQVASITRFVSRYDLALVIQATDMTEAESERLRKPVAWCYAVLQSLHEKREAEKLEENERRDWLLHSATSLAYSALEQFGTRNEHAKAILEDTYGSEATDLIEHALERANTLLQRRIGSSGGFA